MSELYRVFHKGLSGSRTNSMYPANDSFYEKTAEIIEKAPAADYYESIYVYKKEHLDILHETKSLAGIRDVKTNRVVLDFDHDDVAVAKIDAVKALDRLVKITPNPENAIRVFFSGNKGYHIEVHLNSYVDRPQFEDMIYGLAGDLPTFDEKVKDQQRLFRFPLTRNQKTKRYKIPLTQNQLRNLDVPQIEKLAESQDHTPFYDVLNSYTTVDIPEAFKTLKKKQPKVEKTVSITPSDRPDMSRKPKHLTAAKFALQEGFFGDGERNEACMILATTYKYLGYNQETTYNIIKATLRLRARRLGVESSETDKQELWRTIITPVYSPLWKGGTYSEDDGLLAKTIELYELQDIKDNNEGKFVLISEVGERFIEFGQNIDQNIIKTGIRELDENLLITTGMMVGYLGAPSSGKTTNVLNILEYQSMNDIPSFFQSSDMTDIFLYARLLQRYCGWDFKKLLEMVKTTRKDMWPKELKNAWDLVIENFKNVGFSFRSGPTVPDIARNVDTYEQRIGRKVKLVGVDYLEKIKCDKSDATAATGYNAAMLADFSRDQEKATILLLQTQKSAGDPSDELLSMRKIKGASIIEQDCRVVLTHWRPGFNPDNLGINYDDSYASIAIVKNNMGSAGRMDFHWEGSTGKMSSLDSGQRADFDRVVKEAKNRKNAGKNDDNGGLF